MLQVETDRPVFSNAIGDKLTPEQKEARRKRIGSKAKNIYSKAKESGVLQGLENLALGSATTQQGATTNTTPPPPAPETWWSKKTKTQKGIIVTTSLLVVGLSVWYFGFRKTPTKK
jgi:hypothetical protein